MYDIKTHTHTHTQCTICLYFHLDDKKCIWALFISLLLPSISLLPNSHLHIIKKRQSFPFALSFLIPMECNKLLLLRTSHTHTECKESETEKERLISSKIVDFLILSLVLIHLALIMKLVFLLACAYVFFGVFLLLFFWPQYGSKMCATGNKTIKAEARYMNTCVRACLCACAHMDHFGYMWMWMWL